MAELTFVIKKQNLKMSAFLGIPTAVLTDSYKPTHAFLFPEAIKSVAYGEFRSGYNGDKEDTRILFYGIRYIIENYISVKWTLQDVELAEKFYGTHNAENDGYFPIKIEALPEGTACHVHTPVYQITAEKEYSLLVTFLETLITMIWYPTTVATLSRRARDVVEQEYNDTVDDGIKDWSLETKLHDFGFRGCTSLEQSVIGGSAHLINFTGSDTMSAGYYVQFKLNNGKPVASSIPATEHSVMTAHKTEKDAILRMIDRFGIGVFACVMDSYDYANALNKILPSIAAQKVEKGGFMVLRPDSGDQVEVVLMALRAADKVFGSDVNKKGYKIIRGCSVIQGDAVTIESMKKILHAAKEAGYSAKNIAFGMGAGLLQKLNRDTMSFATKLCHITYADGSRRDIMKSPKTETGKISLPGEFVVKRNEHGVPIVYPKEVCAENDPENLLRVVYDHGKVIEWDDFNTIRERAAKEWSCLPRSYDNISPELREKISKCIKEIKSRLEEM
ncbi:4381_t:CDS:10 [Cetraspora pellucida]|uniref:Nicotinamide phosphoribosyltransferase n=1 Tax=Cetraspora pellucida TaxID=1433469 RepID=A0A9N8ZXQ3_9GLOM|nr:4381_t:CDS:10 [Cetraspora pellucida]